MDKIRLIQAITGTIDVGEVLASYKFGAIILDSLQGMVGEDDGLSIEVCKICKRHASKFQTPVIIVSQVNKDGDYAGLMKLQHTVDTLMVISVDEDGIRTIDVEKNRFGRANIFSKFTMTEHGLEAILDDDEDDEDED